MAKRREFTETSILDPMFYLPEGLRGVDYSEDELDLAQETDELTTQEIFGDEDYIEDEGYVVDDADMELAEDVDSPNELTVIEQIIRTLPNGMQVVDLVIDVETVADAIDYDFRVVKV